MNLYVVTAGFDEFQADFIGVFSTFDKALKAAQDTDCETQIFESYLDEEQPRDRWTNRWDVYKGNVRQR